MNKTALKNFAVMARTKLIESVSQRAYEYDIHEDVAPDPNVTELNDTALSAEEIRARRAVCERIVAVGFSAVMEEAAYTWFNRFIALRFMEVNDYLDTHIRVFSDASGAFKPEILREAMHVDLPGLDRNYILELINTQQDEELYKYLLIHQCNYLHENGLKELFEKTGSWTELLFPKFLLREDGVIAAMINEIPEEDWREQVQIIGWLYQYYNTEPKEAVFAGLKKNVKITAQTIPAATQLFTPDWIVRYMVENSLGRLWTLGHEKPENADWRYYLNEAEQEPEVAEKLEQERLDARKIKPQDILLIDRIIPKTIQFHERSPMACGGKFRS